MNLTTALVVLLSHAGFWVGGCEQRIELQWPVETGMPAATVAWDLSAANATLATGKVALPADRKAAVSIAAPAVRAPTDVVWHYRVTAGDGRLLTEGRHTVHLFPDELASLKALTTDTPLLVIDDARGLPATLTAAGVGFERADALAAAAAGGRPVVVVGQDRLADHDPAAGVLPAIARDGASVLVLRQHAAARVLQYDVVARDASGYTIAIDHPLLRHLPAEAWAGLLAAHARQPALALPADEAALELVHSPLEVPGVPSVPLDVLLMTQTVGRGRIVFCQLPLDEAATDARQQRLLLNLIEYARTRPQPTPPRSQRPAAVKAETDQSDAGQILQGK